MNECLFTYNQSEGDVSHTARTLLAGGILLNSFDLVGT